MKKLLLSGCMLLIAVCTILATGERSRGKLQPKNGAELEVVSNYLPSGKKHDAKKLKNRTNIQEMDLDRPDFTPGAPLYLTGDAANLENPWDPAYLAQFTYADGVYTFEAEQVSQIAISCTPGDWDTFNSTRMTVDGGEAMLGSAQPLILGYENIWFPIRADYKIVVAGDLSTITVTTEADIPEPTAPEVYLRGGMNGWGTSAEWQFENVVGTIYKLVTPETIYAGDEFKFADPYWSKINYSTEESKIYPEVEYPMYFLNSPNMQFEEAFDGIIWIDVNPDDAKCFFSENVRYIPNWEGLEGNQGDEINWITVNVAKPGEFAETYLEENNHDWQAAQWLKVTGSLYPTDLSAIKNMPNLRKLDLEETDIQEIPEQFMQYNNKLWEIWLPETLQTIGDKAFYCCSKLRKVEFKNVKTIGARAFSNCQLLKTVDLREVKTIKSYAFSECYTLNMIDLSNVENLGYGSFLNCSSLETVDLSSLKSWEASSFSSCASLMSVMLPANINKIPSASFANCKLASIDIPEEVIEIGEYAFQNNQHLEEVSLPQTLINIDEGSFYGCNSLSAIIIPSKVNFIGYMAFYDTGITEFKCMAVVPPALSGSIVGGDMDMTKAYLYVPSFSKDYYRNTQYWSDFYLMRSLQEPIDYIQITRPLSINLEEEDNLLVESKPTIEMGATQISNWWNENILGELTARGEGTLSAGEFNVKNYMYYSTHLCPSLVNYADKMRADNVTHSFYFLNGDSGRWYFISMPYDVKVSEIVPSKDTYWVIRRYDSALRATGETGKTWVNLTNDDTLEAGKGYIISVAGGELVENENGTTSRIAPSLTFTSGNSVTKNNLFRSTDVIVPLEEHEAEYAHNRSWNFIGNPYPSYFDMHYLNEEFTSPVTVWNGSSYTAYSPVDDNLILEPYQAFFVQCPLNANTITFKEEGRMHFSEARQSRSNAPARNRESVAVMAEERNVFNFTISGEEYEDRARIVLNPEAKREYEIGRDASKFFADNTENAQIFVSGDAVYSIDERPVADGEALLGLRGGDGKVYKLSLGGRHSDEWQVMLTDSETGITVDLCKEDYEFVAGENENPSRFSVRFMLSGNGETGLDEITNDFGADAEVSVVAANGMTIFCGRVSEITVPESGLYIISNGKEARKAILKR